MIDSKDEFHKLVIKKLDEKLWKVLTSKSPWFNIFPPSKKWNWFERTFCKHIIRHIEYIENKLPKGKKVKWNKWTNET